ncbi:MAG: SDR family oxidoreductase [Chloroflexota bacterium]
MKILVLGGTRFVGRHMVDAVLARGHDVTLFHRGEHGAGLFPQAETVRGDRDGGLHGLRGRHWDCAIDTSGYVPRLVRASAELLAGAVDRYVFVSTISVYPDVSTPGTREDGHLAVLDDESTEDVNADTYGGLKVLCERAAEAEMPGRVLVLRLGLVVGPHDPTDRFTYWPHRIAQGGEVLAPGRPQRTVQFIDARDVAEWTAQMVERRGTGTYNVQGPGVPLSFGHLVETCKAGSGSNAEFTWVPDDFLLACDVEPWSHLPLWIPETDDTAGFYSFDAGKAIADGLQFRPIEDTVRDVMNWNAARNSGHVWQAGLSPERERDLLDRYRRRSD